MAGGGLLHKVLGEREGRGKWEREDGDGKREQVRRTLSFLL